jgi:hypothetical protein
VDAAVAELAREMAQRGITPAALEVPPA